jgi:hypothetical protein
MFMDIPAPGLNIGLKIGDAIDDGHGKLGPNCGLLPFLARSHDRPKYYPALTKSVPAGHSRSKDGVASARLCPAIHV